MHIVFVVDRDEGPSWPPLPLNLLALLSAIFILPLLTTPVTHAWDWVPTDEEIQKYRQSWNPLSNGPIFVSGVDVHPQGQLTVHPFIFSQISEKQFGNGLAVDRKSAQTHSYQVNPLVTTAYGITNHLELQTLLPW